MDVPDSLSSCCESGLDCPVPKSLSHRWDLDMDLCGSGSPHYSTFQDTGGLGAGASGNTVLLSWHVGAHMGALHA